MANFNDLNAEQQQIFLDVLSVPADQRPELMRQISIEPTFPAAVRAIAREAWIEGSKQAERDFS